MASDRTVELIVQAWEALVGQAEKLLVISAGRVLVENRRTTTMLQEARSSRQSIAGDGTADQGRPLT